MSEESSNALNPENLVSHGAFLKILSRNLIQDEHKAEDVVQETWLVALKEQPDQVGKLKSWLAAVANNLSYMVIREESRRRKREKATANAPVLRSTADVVVKEGIRKEVVDAVLGLGEPYRSVILYRFYDDLPPRTIAKRLSIPVNTVRTQTRRALEKLRKKLDDHHGGDRRVWCLALAPIAGLKLGTLTAGSGSSSVTLTAGSGSSAVTGAKGTLLALKKIFLSLLPVLVVGAGATLLWWTFILDGEGPADPAKPLALEGPAPGEEVRAPDGPLTRPVPSDHDRARMDDLAGMPAAGMRISGKVVERETGRPVSRFDLDLTRGDGMGLTTARVLSEWVDSASGFFSFPLDGPRFYNLALTAPGYVRYEAEGLFVPEGGKTLDLVIEMDPGETLFGRVVEASTNRPVSGALVIPRLVDPDQVYRGEMSVERALFGYPLKGAHTRTDASGRFTLCGVKALWQGFVALHPDFAEAQLTARPGSGEEALFHLESGYPVTGKVDRGEGPWVVSVQSDAMALPRPVRVDEKGEYRTPPLLPGRVEVTLRRPQVVGIDDYRRPDEGEDQEETRRVQAGHGKVTVDFGACPKTLTWTGILLDQAGEPLPHGKITARIEEHKKGFRRIMKKTAHCDSQGRFTFRDLHGGQCRVVVKQKSPPCQCLVEGPMLSGQGTVEKDLILAGGIITGRAVSGSSGQPLSHGQCILEFWDRSPGHPATGICADLEEDGRFTLIGIPPGVYVLGIRALNHHRTKPARAAQVQGPTFTMERAGKVFNRIAVAESTRVDGVVVRAPSLGRLDLEVIGLDEEQGVARIAPAFKNLDRNYSLKSGPLHRSAGSRWDRSYTLQEGDWKVSIFADSHFMERTVTVSGSEAVRLSLAREDFTRLEARHTVRVKGTFKHGDGTPVAGAALHFYPEMPLPAKMDPNRNKCVTDQQGNFDLDRLVCGKVVVVVHRDGIVQQIPEVVIPEAATDPFLLDLVLPEICGQVKGELYDGQEGRPVHACRDRLHGQVYLVDTATGRRMSYQTLRETSRFSLKEPKPGEYRLCIAADGYLEYRSEPFILERGCELSFGEILLDRAGMLVLEIKNPSGAPITEGIEVRFPETTGPRAFRKGLDTTRGERGFWLPPGRLRFEVEAKGYRAQTFTAVIEAGETVTQQIVLNN